MPVAVAVARVSLVTVGPFELEYELFIEAFVLEIVDIVVSTVFEGL